jgi:iron complex transport system ATP-binding protein
MDIEVKGVTAQYGDSTVLADVDLSVRAGELVGLIGPNGSGKTTLLRILANLHTPKAGVVRYAGKTAAEFGSRQIARRVAYLAQGGEVHWPMRADSVVELGRLPHHDALGGTDARDRDAVERALVAADIVHLRARTMSQVSGGERMRILLARALAVDGDVLLADEPTTALDPLHRLQLMELLRTTVQEGRGVVVVLHDLALAMRFCDRLVLLTDGRVLDEGPPGRVLTDQHLARAYGVDVVRGERDGVPFVLPWRPVSKEAGSSLIKTRT